MTLINTITSSNNNEHLLHLCLLKGPNNLPTPLKYRFAFSRDSKKIIGLCLCSTVLDANCVYSPLLTIYLIKYIFASSGKWLLTTVRFIVCKIIKRRIMMIILLYCYKSWWHSRALDSWSAKIFVIILNENENAKILRLLLYFFIDENTKGNLAIIM